MQVNREEIYQKVWERPMTQVAVEYGISDNGLRKICRKMNIPWPSRGYWQKVANNKKVRRAVLPVLAGVDHVQIQDRKKRPVATDDPQEIIQERLPKNRIVVPSRLASPHPLVSSLKKSLTPSWRYHGLLSGRRGEFDAHVSSASVSRALLIIDALIRALEDRGMSIVIENEGKSATRVRCLDKLVQINLYEKVMMREKKVPSGSFGMDRYDYIPTGELVLQIDKSSYGPKYKDGKRRRLEDCLNEVVIGIYREAFKQKAWDVEREKSRREEEERRRREEELRKNQEIEAAKIKTLEQEAINWQRSRMIKTYIEAKKSCYLKKYEAISPGSDFENWLLWAERYAESLDVRV